ncbi:MAG TPA: hypothetical protein VFZ56_11840 [Gemmatimonadaceae bacterium]
MHLRLIAALLVLPGGAYAQQPPPPPAVAAPAPAPPPGCAAAEHRQFDFWVGEWQVTDSTGTRVLGSNVITQEESGCVLRERWTGAGGGTGQSMNFYDRRTGQWHQVWVASGGGVLRLSGGLDGNSMVLEGDGVSPAGVPIRNRIAWTPQPDGRVRQLWSTSADSGRTWRAGFDGWYARRAP